MKSNKERLKELCDATDEEVNAFCASLKYEPKIFILYKYTETVAIPSNMRNPFGKYTAKEIEEMVSKANKESGGLPDTSSANCVRIGVYLNKETAKIHYARYKEKVCSDTALDNKTVYVMGYILEICDEYDVGLLEDFMIGEATADDLIRGCYGNSADFTIASTNGFITGIFPDKDAEILYENGFRSTDGEKIKNEFPVEDRLDEIVEALKELEESEDE